MAATGALQSSCLVSNARAAGKAIIPGGEVIVLHAIEQFMLYTGIILAGSGLVQLLVKSLPEKEHEAYQDWLRGGEKAELYSPFRIALAPTRDGGGGMVGLSYRF